MTPAIHDASSNLPRLLTSFVGRRSTFEELDRTLATDGSYVTLVGAPGIGKTRTAIEYARERAATFPEREIWFCDLIDVDGPEALCACVGDAVGVSLPSDLESGKAFARVGAWLAGKPGGLLILDNFEHLTRHAGAVADWVRRAPHVRYLVSSRARLQTPGEIALELGPLSVADVDQGSADSEAVQLFIDRSKPLRANLEFRGSQVACIGQIVRQLEGIPLAIEMAASFAHILSPAQILEELGRSSDLLGAKRSDATHHTTLESAIAWSWKLLSLGEQAALACCSVFRGGFSLDAAKEVIGAREGAEPPLIDLLRALCDKSLLYVYEPPEEPDTLRFAQYQIIRRFAADKLDSLHCAAALDRHAAHYLHRAEEWRQALLGPGDKSAHSRLVLERHNLVAIHRRARARSPADARSASQALRAALALDPILSVRGPSTLFLSMLDEALHVPGVDPHLFAEARVARGHGRRIRGMAVEAVADFERALEAARRLGEARLAIRAMNGLGLVAVESARTDEARRWFQEVLREARAIASRRDEAIAIGNLAIADLDEGHLDAAEAQYRDALHIWREVGDRRNEAVSLADLGDIAGERGDLAAARAHLGQALRIFRELGNRAVEGLVLQSLARCDEREGERRRARAQYQEALAILREVGDLRGEAVIQCSLAGIAAAGDRIEEAEALLGSATQVFRGIGTVVEAALLELASGHLDLALARRAAAAGDRESAAKYRTRAGGRLQAQARTFDHTEPVAEVARRSGEVRRAAEQLREALHSAGQAESRSGDALVVSATGHWFRLPRGEIVSLHTRSGPRRLLARLADLRLASPGKALTVHELFESGWPGEQIAPDAAANRVYVALLTLRKEGLKDVLQRRDDGYLLDPRVPLLRSAE